MDEMQVAQQAAKVGGEVLAKAFREGFQLISDGSRESHDLVSDADLASERAIVQTIRNSFPAHAILAEESQKDDASAEHLWIVDPLDGTNNFVHGIPHFAVSIAYYRSGVPQCGVVFNPVRDDFFSAGRGTGAFYNGRPLRVSPASQLNEVLVGVGFYYDRGAMMQATLKAIANFFERKIHGIRRFGTAALDLCHVASGMYGGYFEYELSPWDFAAGRLIVEEAGGQVSNCDGGELPIGTRSALLASNGLLHADMLKIVRQHLPTAKFP
jgi:myo-inositol-1(or 4)-monophosphatase